MTLAQLALVEDELSNNDFASDEEMHALFVESGLTEAQATQALTYRSRYGQNIYMKGYTPILQGDEALRFDPRTAQFERECDIDERVPKHKR
jgi:hypothetical protein